MKIIPIVMSIILILVVNSVSLALDTSTHRLINNEIADSTLNGFSLDQHIINYLGLSQGVSELLNDKRIDYWLELGGEYEDKPPGVLPYLRSVNHFHDPLTKNGFSGVWDIPILLSGQSAVVWAQFTIGTQSPGGYYSWMDVRDNFYRSLAKNVQAQWFR